MQPVRAERAVVLASSAAEVWPLLVDTDRMNRLLGMNSVRYTAVPQADAKTGARLIGETRLGGFNVSYEELPYEWTYRKRFGVQRNFTGGPLHWLRLSWALEPEGEGTKLSLVMEAQPRLTVIRPVAWLNLKRSLAGFMELGNKIDAFVRGLAANPFGEPVSPSDEHAIARAVEALIAEHHIDTGLAKQLGEMIRHAADADCVRIRPYDVADGWKRDRRDVLIAFLHAVAVGLVELKWSIVCPSCRTQADAVPALEDVGSAGHCQMCDISFELDLDRAVEAIFTPAPAIREVPQQMFCIAGPARTPHVLSQTNVPHGDRGALEAPSETGRYRVFVRGGARAMLDVSADGPATGAMTLDDTKLEPAQLAVRAGASIELVNRGAETRHVKLERLDYTTAAATAHEVTTIPEFRRMFSKQLLKRGTPLKVARAAILFTDLTGSTALYTALGDAAAFRLVDDHFDVLRAAVGKTSGAIVKTMGDAVMAAYGSELACVRGALACLEAFEQFRARTEHGALTHIKLGLYAGSSYVITANGALDYFGTTVNVASRLQHLAASGEIILEQSALEQLPAEERARCVVGEPFDVQVKGIDRPLRIVRVRLADGVARA
jgi:adenylate cyclase